jgi:hypothetical protein
MLNTFAQNQNGGVSPQFAILVSGLFLTIGGVLFFQSETVYGLFDNLLAEIGYVTNL